MDHTLKKFGAILLFLTGGLGVFSCPAHAETPPDETQAVIQKASRPTLVPFESEAALEDFLKELAQANERDEKRRKEEYEKQYKNKSPAPAAPMVEAKSASADQSITNVQHAGVDEGDIVKLHGNHLVILRRGRLFTVELGQNTLKPISVVNAYAPDLNPSGTWYDEMLISGDTIAVIGYSYERGGTEIGLFRIDPAGKLSYRATYHLRSNDYYSSRNYASRLIGSQLIFYTPLYLDVRDKDLFHSFPALRKWHTGAKEDEFKRIVSATDVYRPILGDSSLSLHTVTICDLAKPEMECRSAALMGPSSRNFYVSPTAVYVWVTPWNRSEKEPLPPSLVYQLPLNGGQPKALRAAGGPIDQFSFLEEDNFLNVLVQSRGNGDGMWHAEVKSGDMALFRTPLSSFTTEVLSAPVSQYTGLPKPEGYTFQNRFVGDYLLYGSGNSWGYAKPTQGTTPLYAYRFAGTRSPYNLSLPHSVDRIESLGDNAVVVGSNGKDLYFTPLRLGAAPQLATSFIQEEASQGETRSHGFFYKPQNKADGLLGLPIRGSKRPGYAQLFQGSASILFLSNQDLHLKKIGDLDSQLNPKGDEDQCKASCVDWYGNARPIFIRNRIFALMGYELVEGGLIDGKIKEMRRINYLAPLKLAEKDR
jgi:hypothetical protein